MNLDEARGTPERRRPGERQRPKNDLEYRALQDPCENSGDGHEYALRRGVDALGEDAVQRPRPL